MPATSALIEHRKILALPLALPGSEGERPTAKLPEVQQVQLLLPLNKSSKRAVRKREFEVQRKAALAKLREAVARRHQGRARWGGSPPPPQASKLKA